jgi:probable HAF family extracellular repeat protein
MKRLLIAALLSCTASVAFAQGPPTVSRYYVYDVGPITGNLSIFRLNQSGAMIWNSGGHAYLYQSCQNRDLGHLGGGQSIARGISNNGVVVGKSRQASGRWRAFSYSNGAMHDLGGSTNSLIWEEAVAVNFWGDVVGIESVQGTLAPTGVRYQSGVATPMARFLVHPPAGWATPTVADLNDSQYVVGSIVDGGSNLAMRSTNFGYLWTRVNGVPGLEFATFPFAMNRYGHIAGIAGNGLTRAFISRDPAVPATDLGTLGGTLSGALGINNYGWVVGWAEKTNGGGPLAFVHDGTQMTDLNTVLWNGGGWLLREALAVNDAGQIVGEGLLNGQLHAFFLQPMKRPPIFNPCGGVIIQASDVTDATRMQDGGGALDQPR